MRCPSCDFPQVRGTSCPRCGARLPVARAAPPSARGGAGRVVLRGVWLGLGASALAAVGLRFALAPTPPPATTTTPSTQPGQEVPPTTTGAPEPTPGSVPAAPAPAAPTRAEVIPLADVQTARSLNERLLRREAMGLDEIVAAEDLHSRYPSETTLQNLLTNVLVTAARQDQEQRRYDDATDRLRRAAEVAVDSPVPRLALAGVRLDAGDWTGAEAAAREALGLRPGDRDALRQLGYALFRQDRNREAVYALDELLAGGDDPEARALLERIRKGMADEQGMTEQLLSHFHVRYDGDAHEGVGREILRVLERHYVTLARTLDHQPEAPIPVILFSQESYYDASGAPAWSGGVYDGLDGRIRIPIGGLTESLTPDVDTTLLHEVTHAFAADTSHGVCPRDVQEGLAQYMEGKRLDRMLQPEHIAALADGRIPGVQGFYLAALSFVEYLIAQRGQGGMNELLETMGETRSVDEAFRRVYGRDHTAMRQAWLARLRQQYPAAQ